MIKFFRDVLDGPLYIVTTILSVIFIMAIIGFIMERKKLEKEAKEKIAVVNKQPEVVPITPITVEEEKQVETIATEANPISNIEPIEDSFTEVKKPVIVFEDPEQKTE